MNRKVLYIVEGKEGEPRLLKKMWQSLGMMPGSIFIYGTTIHVLADSLFGNGDELDVDLDIIRDLADRETDSEKKEILMGEYSDIILVFDFDPQANAFKIEKLHKMMSFFNESTSNGKLYVNYPMLESYKHMKSIEDADFFERIYNFNEGKYKDIVGKMACKELKHLSCYNNDVIIKITRANIKKANYLITGKNEMPSEDDFIDWNGTDLLDIEYRFFDSKGCVYVLCTLLFDNAYNNLKLFFASDG